MRRTRRKRFFRKVLDRMPYPAKPAWIAGFRDMFASIAWHDARATPRSAGVARVLVNKQSAFAVKYFFEIVAAAFDQSAAERRTVSGVFQETDVRLADHARLLHRLFQVVGTGKPARAIETVPIAEDALLRAGRPPKDQTGGSVSPARLPRVQMRVEGFFPAAVIRNFMPNDHVNHETSSKLVMNSQGYEIRGRIGNLQMHASVT